VSLQLRQIHSLFVAKASGVDLRQIPSSSLVAEIDAAMDKYGVLVFKRQPLNQDEQYNFSCTFAADPSGTTGYVPSSTGILTIIPFVTANTINLFYENNTAASITPGAETVHCSAMR